MLAYLTAETGFLRAFGNRSLLLVVLCVLSRTKVVAGKTAASVMGVSLDVSQGLIVTAGPVLALLLIASLKIEADSLALARLAVAEDAAKLDAKTRAVNPVTYALFAVPALAAAFLVWQFLTEVAPFSTKCDGWSWTRHFHDTSVAAGPSIYCLGNATEGMPWIYPPYEAYVLLAVLGACIYLTARLAAGWNTHRTVVQPAIASDGAS